MKNKFEQIGSKLDKLLLDLNHFVEENKNEKNVNKELFEKQIKSLKEKNEKNFSKLID